MSRHIKRYHCPGGKNYKSAKSTRIRPVKIKCEFCGKDQDKSYLPSTSGRFIRANGAGGVALPSPSDTALAITRGPAARSKTIKR